MESELTREPARREHDDEMHGKGDVQLDRSPSRCPFCRQNVSLETQEWVVCEGCLARHHATCWRENGSCSCCRGTAVLARRRRSAAGPLWIALSLVLVVAAGVVALGARSELKRSDDLVARDARERDRDAQLAAMRAELEAAQTAAKASKKDSQEANKWSAADEAILARSQVKDALNSLHRYWTPATQTISQPELVANAFVKAARSYERAGMKERAARVREAAKFALDEGPTNRVNAFLQDEPDAPQPTSLARDVEIAKLRLEEESARRVLSSEATGVVSNEQVAQARIRLLDAAAAYEKLGLAEDAKRVLALASPEDARTAKPPKTP